MTVKKIVSPFEVYTDTDGDPLENGKIYIGEANKDPETDPITAYWDSSLTTPAAQPVRNK